MKSFEAYAFRTQREVDFFLRIHRHLPDEHCGDLSGACNYRLDGIPINQKNERFVELKKDPAFVEKEKEVTTAVEQKWRKT